MPIEIYMPALSPTMESGTLSKWLVKEGDEVTAGDVLAEIETDKATMEVESIDEGTVGKIIVAEGTEDVPVGELIAVLLEEGEDADALQDLGKGGGSAKGEAKSEPKEDKSKDQKADTASKDKAPQPSKAAKQDAKAEIAKPAPAAPSKDGERIFASPLARRMAKQMGLDLTQIKGSGPRGRIVKADVEAAEGKTAPAAKEEKAAPADKPAATAAAQPDFTPPADVPYEEIKLSGMRKVIARRMTEAKQQVPHFYLTIDCSVDALLAQRKVLNDKLADDGVKLSVNDFIIRACAIALKKVPAANAMFAGDKMYRFQRQDISVAVAVEGGLVTPVIKDAGSKGLAAISEEMKTLAGKARDGKLTPDEMSGGTFSISNLGMYGIREFGAVINPPQGAILAVGAGEKRPVVDGDAVAIKTMMTVTLSVDHRVLDGAIGSEFLAVFKTLIEDPIMMLA